MRLIKFLFGLTVGAAVGVLLAPKSGRELREQLRESASGTLLPPPVEDFPPVEASAPGADVTSFADEPAVIEEPFPAAVVDDAPTGVGLAADLEDEAPAEAVVLAEPIAVAPAETTVEPETVEPEPSPEAATPRETAVPPGEDLLLRIEETRAAVQADLSEPFGLSDSAEPSAPTETMEETPGSPVAEGGPFEELPGDVATGVEPVAEEEVHEELLDEAGLDESEPSIEDVAQEETDHAGDAAALLTEQAGETGGPDLVADTVAAEPPESPVRPWGEETDAEGAEELVAAVEEPVIEIEEPIAVVTEPVEALEEPVLPTETANAWPPGKDDQPARSEEVPAKETDATMPEGEDVEQVDQAEMRRRIEETRSRLKAKAFDAMMTGESALLRNDTGVNPVPKGDDAALEPEIDSTIDESFSQEDV